MDNLHDEIRAELQKRYFHEGGAADVDTGAYRHPPEVVRVRSVKSLHLRATLRLDSGEEVLVGKEEEIHLESEPQRIAGKNVWVGTSEMMNVVVYAVDQDITAPDPAGVPPKPDSEIPPAGVP